MKLIFLMILGFNILFAELIVGLNIVSDTKTHLQWENNETSAIIRHWESAISHCENFDLNANNDWRLPNIRELKSIVDRTLIAPSMDRTKFTTIDLNIRYWSSSTYLETSSNDYAWATDFGGGISNLLRKTADGIARCVRDSE